MKYMSLLHNDPADCPDPTSAEFGSEMQRWFADTHALTVACVAGCVSLRGVGP